MPYTYLAHPDGDSSSPRDSGAICDGCGRRGTAVRVTRHATPAIVTRYCSSCWRDLRSEISPPLPAGRTSPGDVVAFLAQAQEDELTVVSRSWDDTLDFVRYLTHPVAGLAALPASSLDRYRADVAAEIRAGATDMDGPMPPEVRAFVERHHRPVA